jgi:uncharacterized protein (DUF3084 family)
LSQPKGWYVPVLGTVAAAIFIGGPAIYINSLANEVVDEHDTSDRAHVVQHRDLKDSLAIVKGRQQTFQNEINHINKELDEAKEERKEIEKKLDQILMKLN